MLRTFKTIVLASTALLVAGSAGAQSSGQDLSNPDSAFEDTLKPGNWHTVTDETEHGHLIGNPKAEARLIEFVSYTCGHCASFAREGDPVMDLTLLMPGDMSIEIRPVIRNAVDLTISMLVSCGDPKNFKALHNDFMLTQSTWMAKIQSAPQSQQEIWLRGDKNARLNAASALDFDDKLAAKGMSIADVRTCLSDDAEAQRLIEKSTASSAEFSITGTPSFALDGELLDGVHQWATLEPVLVAKLRPAPSGEAGFFDGQ